MSRVSDSTLAEITFRQGDNPNTHLAKLEKLRHTVLAAKSNSTSKILFLSITGGLPAAHGPLFRLRVPTDKTLTIGRPITGDANTAATGTVSLVIKKNGVANGAITFSGTQGSGFATDANYPTGSLFEIWAPVTADATLDDVSLSIPVTFG